jgi:cell division protein FtsB
MRGIKTKGNGKWKRVAGFLALLLIFGFLLNSVRNVYQKKELAQETLARMEKEAADLKSREAFLKESLQKLNTAEGMNFEMRKKLNVAEVGESVAVIVDNPAPAPATQPTISVWQKMKDFLVGLFK